MIDRKMNMDTNQPYGRHHTSSPSLSAHKAHFVRDDFVCARVSHVSYVITRLERLEPKSYIEYFMISFSRWHWSQVDWSKCWISNNFFKELRFCWHTHPRLFSRSHVILFRHFHEAQGPYHGRLPAKIRVKSISIAHILK